MEKRKEVIFQQKALISYYLAGMHTHFCLTPHLLVLPSFILNRVPIPGPKVMMGLGQKIFTQVGSGHPFMVWV